MPEVAGRTRIAVTGASPYDVLVGRDLVGELPGLVGPAALRVALIYDGDLTTLSTRWRLALADAGYEVTGIPLVPPGEQAKSAAMAQSCWEVLGLAGFTRSDVVVTLGGGSTTDLGGFVAATWLRGVRVVHVPTTLLAMVDAAVGGKTVINTAAGKNLVGSFHEPAGVLCDLDLLDTLPQAELVAGLGEVVKCGFIADGAILDLVRDHPTEALDPRSEVLRELVERSVRVKAEVVSADLRETGGRDGHPGREALNYGHTLAHAIERATDYAVRHGEAVALGTVFVAEVARATGQLTDADADLHTTLLASVGLPTRVGELAVQGLDLDVLLAGMRIDKKSRGDQLRFVVLEGLGRPTILAGPDEQVLRSAYAVLEGGR
ncbi:MAG: aroB [Marmoricola sp.]|nr:aroB [Marmoricola sp.]